jgi:radical SAM protein with 4Fe4S-binding SPASM domain
MEDWQRFSDFFLSPPQPAGQEDNVYHCGGGVNSFGVDPAGQMSICSISMKEKFDLREGTVAEGWDQFLQPIRERKTTRVTKCTACHLKSACGMCPANAELENGDAETPVEFLCHVAHLRAELFGWTVPTHGECEFCEGGIHRARVVQGGAFLRKRLEAGGGGPPEPMLLLPSLGAGVPTTACGSGVAREKLDEGRLPCSHG